MQRTSVKFAALATAGCLLAALPAFAASASQPGEGQAIVTILPGKNEQSPNIAQENLSVKVDGKSSQVTRWQQFAPNSPVELVILIDGGARSSLSLQMQDIARFVEALPPSTRATIAYMENGRAALTGPLTTDRVATVRGLHITGPGIPDYSASPYFCLSDLAQHWPSSNRQARREVIMITDGVDYYDGARRYDPEDPYLQAAITDAVRSKIVVYSIYWRNVGRIDRSLGATDAGQNLLAQLTQAVGGNDYWIGFGNPVTIKPYLDDITRRLNNQYEVAFMAPSSGKPQVANFRLRVNAAGAKVDAPQQVLVVGQPRETE
jgi:hypothetical protein